MYLFHLAFEKPGKTSLGRRNILRLILCHYFYANVLLCCLFFFKKNLHNLTLFFNVLGPNPNQFGFAQ